MYFAILHPVALGNTLINMNGGLTATRRENQLGTNKGNVISLKHSVYFCR